MIAFGHVVYIEFCGLIACHPSIKIHCLALATFHIVISCSFGIEVKNYVTANNFTIFHNYSKNGMRIKT